MNTPTRAAAALVLLLVSGVVACTATTSVSDGGSDAAAIITDATTVDATTTTDAATDAAKDGGGSFDCRPTGGWPCPNDSPFTATDVSNCEITKSGPCGAQFIASTNCLLSKITCGPDQKTDPASSAKAQTECSAEVKAFTTCRNPGDAGSD